MSEEVRRIDIEHIRALLAEEVQCRTRAKELQIEICDLLEAEDFCGKCGIIDPPDGFYRRHVYWSESVHDMICKGCSKEYEKQKAKEARDERKLQR